MLHSYYDILVGRICENLSVCLTSSRDIRGQIPKLFFKAKNIFVTSVSRISPKDMLL